MHTRGRRQSSPADRCQVGDPVGEGLGLASTRASNHKQGFCIDGGALLAGAENGSSYPFHPAGHVNGSSSREGQQQDAVRINAVGQIDLPWAGTFHAVGARILREYAHRIGLQPSFTILDRSHRLDRRPRVDRQRIDGQARVLSRKSRLFVG
jgi:UvrD/REP helicase N-terminal domain